MSNLQKNQDKNYAAVANAAGTATVTFRAERNVPWLVKQVTNKCPTTSSGAQCGLFKNGNPITPLVPQFDAAGGDPPVQFRPSDIGTVVWTGLTPGDQCTVVVFYDEVEWTS